MRTLLVATIAIAALSCAQPSEQTRTEKPKESVVQINPPEMDFTRPNYSTLAKGKGRRIESGVLNGTPFCVFGFEQGVSYSLDGKVLDDEFITSFRISRRAEDNPKEYLEQFETRASGVHLESLRIIHEQGHELLQCGTGTFIPEYPRCTDQTAFAARNQLKSAVAYFFPGN